MGYEKVNLSAGLNMIGVQFTDVGATDAALATFGTLSTNLKGFDETETYENEMWVWNGNGYTYYGWNGTTPSEWDASLAEFDNIWTAGGSWDTVPVTTHDKSAGFWIKAAEAGSITLSGEVPTNKTITVQLKAGLNMVANPYPGNVSAAQFGVLSANLKGFDETETYENEMWYWNGNGYDYYGWNGTTPSEWDSSLAEFDNVWTAGGAWDTIPSTTIPYGHAVWLKCAEAGTITFTSPVSE